MIEKLKKLEKSIQEHTEGEITISQELYDLLVAEANQTKSLLELVNGKRAESTARVLSNKEFLSEQVEEIKMPELGLTQYEIDDYRSYRHSETSMDAYEGTLEEKELKKLESKITPFLRGIPSETFYLSFLSRQAKGSLAVYDILEDAYVSEFLKSMNCYSQEDINQTFGGMVVNLMQIDWLYKNYQLDYHQTYVAFLNKNGEILPYNIWSARRKKPSSYGPITNLRKKTKMILFYPEDLLDKE